MKKKIAFLAVLTALGLASCGGTPAASPAASSNPPATSSQSKEPATSSQGPAESSSTAPAASSSTAPAASSSEPAASNSSEPAVSSSQEPAASSSVTPATSSSEAPAESFVRIEDPSAIYNEDASMTNKMMQRTAKQLWSDFERITIEPYKSGVTYEHKLEKPSPTVHNVDEFSNLLDYYAFYGDGETFEVVLASDYPNPAESSLYKAFYNSKLCVSSVGLNRFYDPSAKTFTIQMLFNERAANYKAKWFDGAYREPITIPYQFPTSGGDRTNDFTDYPYLTKNTKGELDVYNSEQLLYALEFGYLPIVKEGSPAELVMNKAKEILRGIIKQDMTEKDKVAAIYAYLNNKNTYDTFGDEYATFVVEDQIYPEYMASSFRSFYAEGGILDGYCVCQGYGKSFNILANIEGLDSIKVSGRYGADDKGICSNDYTEVDGEVTSATYSSHGYSWVKNEEDGKYYICDVTYASHSGFYPDYPDTGRVVRINRNFAAMMTYEKWSELYSEVTDYFHATDKAGHATIDMKPYVKFGATLSERIAEVDDLEQYVMDLAAFLQTYNDPLYTVGHYYCFNVSITEVDEGARDPSELVPILDDIMSIHFPGMPFWRWGNQSTYFSWNASFIVVIPQ